MTSSDPLVAQFLSKLPSELHTADVLQWLETTSQSPPMSDASDSLGEWLTVNQVKSLLFAPTPSDAKARWPRLALGSRACRTLVYLGHMRDWGFVRAFSEGGGLRVLSEFLDHPDLGERAQSIDSLMQMTGYHEWQEIEGKEEAARGLRDAERIGWGVTRVRDRRLARRARGGGAEAPEAETGGEFYELQLTAFWVSWVRLKFCGADPARVRCGEAIVAALREWEADEALSQDERDLARTFREDVGRYPCQGDRFVFDFGEVKAEKPPPAAEKKKPEAELTPATKQKELGNECFKNRQYTRAISHYDAGLRLDPSMEVLKTNKALSHLKRGEERAMTGKKAEARFDYHTVVEICSALPDNEKARGLLERAKELLASG
jgi:hypothetical protein